MVTISTTTKKATLLVALLSTLSLTACISDENHQVKHINPNGNDGTSSGIFGKVKVTTFDVQYDKEGNNKVSAIIKTDETIQSGQANYVSMPIFGQASLDKQPNPKSTSYVLSDLFNFVLKPDDKLSDRYVPKSDLTYYYDLHENGTRIRHQFDYQGVDIAHVSGVANNATKGINTILNNLPKTKQHKFDFPNGSKCYTLNQSNSQPYFSFSSSDVISFATLADWQNAMTTPNSKSFINEQVGKDNASSAIYYNQSIKPVTDNSIASYQYPAAVQYEGKIYNATYNKAYDIMPNSDPNKGLVTCQAYNKVASDYISQQIANHYR